MNEKIESLKIRAHHLLCLQGFQGYGYNEEFVRNFRKIVEAEKGNSNLELELVAVCDDICSACPHNVEEICKKESDSEEKIEEMDELVLKQLGLEEGAVVSADEVLKLVNEKINKKEDIKLICGDCEWVDKCLWVHKQKKL